MKTISKALFLFLLVSFVAHTALSATASKTAPAKVDDKLIWMTIKKGAMVRVDLYDKGSDTYKVVVTREKVVGPLFTRFEDIAKAIGFSEIARLKKNPTLIIGNEYQIDTPVQVLSAIGLAKRKSELGNR